jgi:hypothetical protein
VARAGPPAHASRALERGRRGGPFSQSRSHHRPSWRGLARSRRPQGSRACGGDRAVRTHLQWAASGERSLKADPSQGLRDARPSRLRQGAHDLARSPSGTAFQSSGFDFTREPRVLLHRVATEEYDASAMWSDVGTLTLKSQAMTKLQGFAVVMRAWKGSGRASARERRRQLRAAQAEALRRRSRTRLLRSARLSPRLSPQLLPRLSRNRKR